MRLDAGGFPIVASAKSNPYALEEAKYLVNQMLGDQNELRQAIIASGGSLVHFGLERIHHRSSGMVMARSLGTRRL